VARSAFQSRRLPHAARLGIDIAIEQAAIADWDCVGTKAGSLVISEIKNVHDNGGTARYADMDEPFVYGPGPTSALR
jgi:hypothetical protein